jgi:four helix bundle protein
MLSIFAGRPKGVCIVETVTKKWYVNGANVREAEQAQSKPDFIHKLSIAIKETNETLYWLELLSQSGYLKKIEFESIYQDCIELIKLLTSIIKKSKTNIGK